MTKAYTHKLRTCLWFEKDGLEAARFYCTLLPDSHLEGEYEQNPSGPPLVVEFSLAGAPFMALNGGMKMEASPAVSISVLTEDQTETDRLWAALTANGGEESHCGWLKDRWGVSWQIVPKQLPQMMSAPDKAAAARAQAAMMTMSKIDIAAMSAAFKGR